jgi:soluble lytic murein transglycosylase-like protein
MARLLLPPVLALGLATSAVIPNHDGASGERSKGLANLDARQVQTSPASGTSSPGRLSAAPASAPLRSLDASTGTTTEAATVTVRDLADGHNAGWWRRRALSNSRTMRARGLTIRRLKRTLGGRSSVRDAIALAAVVYRVPYSTLDRKAWCESRYSPAARNPSGAMGLFQFLGSTWASTPFAAFSPYDPLAAALAAGWMHRAGRGGEWSCK